MAIKRLQQTATPVLKVVPKKYKPTTKFVVVGHEEGVSLIAPDPEAEGQHILIEGEVTAKELEEIKAPIDIWLAQNKIALYNKYTPSSGKS